MDAILEFMPAPTDIPAIEGVDEDSGGPGCSGQLYKK